MNATEYHINEITNLTKRIARLELAPLADRKEAMQDAASLMRNLPIVARNLEWLLEENYGYAEQYQAQRIAEMKRGNRAAQAMQLLAALDCYCPARECVDAWKTLSDAEKEALDKTIIEVLNNYKEEIDIDK